MLDAVAADVGIEVRGHDEPRTGRMKRLGLRAVDDRAGAEDHVGQPAGHLFDERAEHVESPVGAVGEFDDAHASGVQGFEHPHPVGGVAAVEKRQKLLPREQVDDRGIAGHA